MIKKKFSRETCLFLFISFLIFIFYLFKINLSIDTILVFLSNKIFLGSWLAKGIFPLYNPHIFLGIPFAFDVGLGNLHPFNIFFLLPYPLSFASWMAATTFLFLYGYYTFFYLVSKDRRLSVLLTLILFLSGSGFLRSNNPTMYLVIAHYGFFMSSFIKLIKKTVSREILFWGILLTLSGHIQFVFYGYILGMLMGIVFLKVSLRKMIINYILLFTVTSWYYLLSIPLALTSTRISDSSVYLKMGYLQIQQVLQFLLPFFLGYIKNGSRWNVGYTYVVLISVIFLPLLGYLGIKRKIKMLELIVFMVLIIAAFGLVNFPFFRAPSQTLVLIHIWGITIIARNRKEIEHFYLILTGKKIALIGLMTSVVLGLLFYSQLFSFAFVTFYKIIKHGRMSLFFDVQTIQAVGKLIAVNFVIYILFFLIAILTKKKFSLFSRMFLFIVVEGIFINSLFNYFIPQSILIKNYSLPKEINSTLYRVQTGADVIPYFGFHTYMSDILLRPPFSKEPSIITPQEELTHEKLSQIMSYYPLTWSMTYGLNVMQGYNTFVPKKISLLFKEPSTDYRQVYDYIIKRNSLYGQSEIGLDINDIETSKITLYDPRWTKLGIKYFISDRPLKNFHLVYKDSRYFYENPSTLPIYRIEDSKKNWTMIAPTSIDPNKYVFQLNSQDIGKTLVLTINPSGFIAEQDGQRLVVTKKNFELDIPIKKTGQIVIYYSPMEHLKETL